MKKFRFSGEYKSVDKFIKVNNIGNKWNNYIPYRYFWDYDHQSMLAGRSPDNQKWDIFIDGETELTPDDCTYSTYYSYDRSEYDPEGDESTQCYTQHQTYYDYARNYLYYGKNDVLRHTSLKPELPNPLTSEPLFMILQKDLLDIYKGR